MLQIQNLISILSINMLLLVYAADSTETSSTKATTPFEIPSCHEKDENFHDCLLKAFAEMIPRSKDGIPEINVPPTDPYIVKKTSYLFSHPFVQGKITVKNIKIYDLSKIITKSLVYKRQGDHVIFTVKAFVPKLFAEGMYKAKIKINNANISSQGSFNVTLSDIDVNVYTASDVYERDGHRYVDVKTLNFNPTVGNMKIYAEGLLPDPSLNAAILEFLNQNWRPIYKTLIPETRAAWEPELVKLVNQYFSRITVDAVIKDH